MRSRQEAIHGVKQDVDIKLGSCRWETEERVVFIGYAVLFECAQWAFVVGLDGNGISEMTT